MVTKAICIVKGIRLQNPSPNACADRSRRGAVGQRAERHDDHRDRDEDESIGEPALGPGGEANAEPCEGTCRIGFSVDRWTA